MKLLAYYGNTGIDFAFFVLVVEASDHVGFMQHQCQLLLNVARHLSLKKRCGPILYF